MCYSPITVRNKRYDPAISRSHYDIMLGNTWDQFIDVPCGHCSQCISKRQSDILQRVQSEAMDSYVYMFTLTYNEDSVPKITLPETGITLKRLYYKHVLDMFKRIRTAGYFGERKFKYICTGEYGELHNRPHYHGLLFLKKMPGDSRFTFINLEAKAKEVLLSEWKENIATTIAKRTTKRYKAGDVIKNTRRPIYRPLCTFTEKYVNGQLRTTFDLHYVRSTASKGDNDVSFYVSKYLFKDSNSIKYLQSCCFAECVSGIDGEEENDRYLAMKMFRQYFASYMRKSQNFGAVYTDESYKEYRSSHDRSKLHFNKPVYDRFSTDCDLAVRQDRPISIYDIYTGKAMPLCDYYAERLPMKFFLYHKKKKLLYQLDHPAKDIDLTQDDIKLRHREKIVIGDLFDDPLLFNS